MIKQITKLSKLQRSDIRHIKRLIDIGRDHDGYNIKIYWHIIQNRLTQEFNDFLYFIDGNLVGYFALFTFETDEVELTACIHPKYRHRGLFRKLFAEALLEIRQRNVARTLWICPQNSKIGKAQMEALGGKYTYSQVEMVAKHAPLDKPVPTIHFKEATKDDLNLLAKLGAASFNASFTETLERFKENMAEKNRTAWLVLNENQENIGKIHVRYDENRTVFIHDLCITPEHQGKGYGFAMITKMMEQLRQKGWRNLTLDVECNNQGALKLYEQCGFVISDGYDYWSVPTKNL